MKKLFFGVLAIAGLVACVQEDVLNAPNLKNEIGFGGYVNGAVRTANPSTTTESIDHFTVWAYMDDKDGNVLTDELVSKSGDAWIYSNVQYWLKKHQYHFFALSPYRAGEANNADVTLSEDPYTNYLGGLAYTNVEGTEDLLYATATPDTFQSIPEHVQFDFDHLLSKVKFTFVNGFTTDNIDIAVTNVKMVVPQTAETTLGAQVHNGYVWTKHAGETVLDFGHAGKGDRIDATKNAGSDNERLTFPAKVADNLTYKVTFTVDVFVGTQEVSADTHNLEVSVNGVEFVAGKAYNFVAEITNETLDLKKIEFKVTVDEWDQETVEHNAYEYIAEDFGIDTITGFYHVESETGLAALAAHVNSGNSLSGKTVVLDTDIDLAKYATRSSSAWSIIGNDEYTFDGTFDGKGHTIKNLNIVSTEPGYFAGFFGCAVNATIKNVVFENINVNVASDDTNEGGHIAGVVGYLAGTALIDNVTIKGDVKVESTFENQASSRVAVLVGGNFSTNDITIKNVKIEANEGSYVKANSHVGALGGQLTGKLHINNCSSNINVEGYKFFAGGLVGCAAAETTIKNCQVSGNVSISNGRAGNINDLYRVGALAGGWDDNTYYPFVVTNCSYTGKLSGKDANGATAALFDCAGYVGRGYSTKADSKVVIDGVEYIYKGNGTFEINGELVAVVANADALTAAVKNGVKKIYLQAGTYTLASYPAGVELIGGNGEVILDVQGKKYGVNGDVTIENVKLVFANADYTGFQHTNVESYKNCTIVGQPFLYGNEVTFEGCTFEQTSAGAYNVWTYGAKKVNFVNCEFNSAGKSVLVYTESSNGQKLSFEGCTLNASAPVEGKAAIEVDSSLISGIFEVVVNNTTANGFGLGNVSGNSLWNNKKGENTTIIVDGKAVLVAGYEAAVDASEAGQAALKETAANGGDVILAEDVTTGDTDSNGYGATGVVVNGGTLDGNGHSLAVEGATSTWDSAVSITSGTIKNISIIKGFRGIFVNKSATGEPVILDNVTIEGPTYTISCDGASKQGLEAYNSTFNGWTSYAATIGWTKFTNCSFGKGAGYAFARPYATTEFVNCDFAAGYKIDPRAAVTFENCTIAGVALTADNLATLVTSNIANATVK